MGNRPFGTFVMLAQRVGNPKLEELAWTGLRARLVFALIERLEYGNRVFSSGYAIAKELGATRQAVNRELKWMEETGLLKRRKVRGRACIVLDERRFWKGDERSRKDRIRQTLADRMRDANMTGVVTGGKVADDKGSQV